MAAKCGNTGNTVQVTVFVNEIRKVTLLTKNVILIVLAFSVLGISKKYYWQCVKDESIEVNITFDIPDEAQESPLNESLPRDTSVPADHPTTYTIIEKGPNKVKSKLVDSDGHSYCKKRETDSGVIWWNCSVHNKKVYCKALVMQEGDVFQSMGDKHICPRKPNEDIAVTIKTKIIDHAASQIFISAAEIVNDVLQQDLQDVPVPTLSAPANLIWTANHHFYSVVLNTCLCEEW